VIFIDFKCLFSIEFKILTFAVSYFSEMSHEDIKMLMVYRINEAVPNDSDVTTCFRALLT